MFPCRLVSGLLAANKDRGLHIPLIYKHIFNKCFAVGQAAKGMKVNNMKNVHLSVTILDRIQILSINDFSDQ